MDIKLVPPHRMLMYHKIACKSCNKLRCLKIKFKKDPTNTFGLGKAYVHCTSCNTDFEHTEYYISIEERSKLWKELTVLPNEA